MNDRRLPALDHNVLGQSAGTVKLAWNVLQ